MSTRKPTATPAVEKDKEGVAETQSAVTKTTDLAGGGDHGVVEDAKKAPETPEVKGPTQEEIDKMVEDKVAKRLEELAKEEKGKTAEAVAEVQEKEVKKVKVKFIKDHSFYVNTEKNDAKINDVLMVERHMANKLVGRHIAYILG